MKRFLLVVLIILFFFAEEVSGLMVKMDLEELTRKAERIILGKVKDIECRWNEEKTKIYTYITILIEEDFKGISKENEITIRQLGGRVDGLTMWVSDTPEFKKGEVVLVFIRGLKKAYFTKPQGIEKKYFTLVGRVQGKFTVKDKMVLEKGVKINDFIKEIKTIIKRQQEER